MMIAVNTLVLLAIASHWAHAQTAGTADQSEAATENDGKIENSNGEIFKELFITKRKQHLNAVKNLRSLHSYEKQYEMISIIIKNVNEIVGAKKGDLEGIKEGLKHNRTLSYVPHELRDGLSSVLENTAFFGDLVLQLPEITHRILEKNAHWKSQMHWSLNFVNETRFLIDEATGSMLDLAFQELNITQRLPNYSNPYSAAYQNDLVGKTEKKRKEKKKHKKGPRMVHVDL